MLDAIRSLDRTPLFIKAIAAEVARRASETYLKAFESLGPAIERWLRLHEEAVEILQSRGWWAHPQWPTGVFTQVVALKHEKRLRSLDRMICDTYEANRCSLMHEALRRWGNVPEFNARRKIIAEGLWAYRKGKYTLAVSAWLPHVEGVLCDVTVRNGWGSGGWKRTAKEIVEEKTFLRACLSLFDERPYPLKRDPVLHGSHLQFGTRTQAVRVFLMLDALHFFISESEKAARKAA
ncbi:MAG: hypothetical protein ACXWH0_14815 [Acidimicrobiia bacterium]